MHCFSQLSNGPAVLARWLWRTAALLGAGVVVLGAAGARAQDDAAFHELETKYIFGSFTVGSSTGIEGEKSFESENLISLGKRSGRYGALQSVFEFEYTPNQFMQVEFGPIVSAYDIRGVPGLDDRSSAGIGGFEAAFRSVLLDRGALPLAVTLAIEPEFHSLDETSGARVVNYGLETKLQADAELIKNRLYLGLNLLYEPETTRADLGDWDDESTIGGSAALAWHIIPNVAIGADLWYLRHYDGLLFRTFTGDAVYLGPTFFWQISRKVLMSAAWETQVAGREIGMPGPFDLTDFSRTRARLLFEYEF
jgi:hypothetical protein